MLPVKYMVALIAVCACVVSSEGYSPPEGTGSAETQEQLGLTPTLPKTLHDETILPVEETEVYVPTLNKTPYPEILESMAEAPTTSLSVEGTEVYVPTPTELPCPQLPTPTLETESETEALTTETLMQEDVPETPSPVLTLVPETYPTLASTPYIPTPAPTIPCPTFTLVPETEADQNEEMTKAYLTPASAIPYTTLTMASETEAGQNEEATETYSTPAQTIPCPTFTLVPETEASHTEETTEAYPIATPSELYTPAVLDVLLLPFAEAPTETTPTDEAAMADDIPCPEGSTDQDQVVTDETIQSGDTIDTGSKTTDVVTTDDITMDDVATTDDGISTYDLGDTLSDSLPTYNRNLRSN